MDELFYDMLKKGLISTGGQELDLSKMTTYQAASYIALMKHPTTDYLSRDLIHWQDWLKTQRN